MLTAAKYACLVLLFLLGYSSILHLLQSMVRNRATSRKLTIRRTAWLRWIPGSSAIGRLHRHISDLLKSTRMLFSASQFVLLSLIMCCMGLTVGFFYFSSLKGVIVLGVLLLSAPYIGLRSRLVTQQMKNRIDFLPAVESFYQIYVLSESKNVRAVLRGVVDSERIPFAVRQVFEQLFREMIVHRSLSDSLRVFTYALGSRWADHFASILRYALEDGADISNGLQELIADMRRALRNDQADRNRLLEIRIANFSPLLFLIVFLIVNFKIDYEQAYHYYVLSAAGRDMLLDALLLIGISFGMGLYLSMRKI